MKLILQVQPEPFRGSARPPQDVPISNVLDPKSLKSWPSSDVPSQNDLSTSSSRRSEIGVRTVGPGTYEFQQFSLHRIFKLKISDLLAGQCHQNPEFKTLPSVNPTQNG